MKAAPARAHMWRQSHPLLTVVARRPLPSRALNTLVGPGYQSAEKTIEISGRNYEKSNSKAEYSHLKWGI